MKYQEHLQPDHRHCAFLEHALYGNAVGLCTQIPTRVYNDMDLISQPQSFENEDRNPEICP
jgi:hypothetical protein